MPTPQEAKTGPDYARLQASLNNSKTQKTNNALFQTIDQLIKGVRTFQGFITGRFDILGGNLSSIFDTVNNILGELEIRNNTKFSISLTNSEVQTISDVTETNLEFDTTIFDDGLMKLSDTTFEANSTAQYLISGRVNFCAVDETVTRRVRIKVNGIAVAVFSIASQNKLIIPFVYLVELIEHDIVTITAYQDSGGSMDVVGSVAMHRVSYVNHTVFSGRRLTEIDTTICTDEPSVTCTFPDHTSTVVTARANYVSGGGTFATNQSILDIAVAVCNALVGVDSQNPGLLQKLTGDNIASYGGTMVSISRVMYPNGEIFKILSDAGVGGTNGAQWVCDGTVDPSRYVPI